MVASICRGDSVRTQLRIPVRKQVCRRTGARSAYLATRRLRRSGHTDTSICGTVGRAQTDFRASRRPHIENGFEPSDSGTTPDRHAARNPRRAVPNCVALTLDLSQTLERSYHIGPCRTTSTTILGHACSVRPCRRMGSRQLLTLDGHTSEQRDRRRPRGSGQFTSRARVPNEPVPIRPTHQSRSRRRWMRRTAR